MNNNTETFVNTKRENYYTMRLKLSRFMIIGLLSFMAITVANAQNGTIFLFNSSFEDLPRHSHTPVSWVNCGFPTESAPDIHPDYRINEFQVSKEPTDGRTYLGMVVRANDTWESVGQQMSNAMDKDKCYEFSISLARSLSYISGVDPDNPDDKVNFVTPAKLRVWAGFGFCDKRFLLDETPLVKNNDWQEFHLKFEPNENYTHIVLEVFYKTPTLFPYNGNILLDRASALTIIECDTEVPHEPQDIQPLAVATPKGTPPVQITPVRPTPSPTPETSPVQQEAEISGVKRSELSTGQTIQMETLQFEADSARIINSSRPALEELYGFLSTHNDVVVEIGGHTSGWAEADYAVELSTARAKSVVEYLTGRGIASSRLSYKGYGKSKPIASNTTSEGRRRNQRVEIKILNMN